MCSISDGSNPGLSIPRSRSVEPNRVSAATGRRGSRSSAVGTEQTPGPWSESARAAWRSTLRNFGWSLSVLNPRLGGSRSALPHSARNGASGRRVSIVRFYETTPDRMAGTRPDRSRTNVENRATAVLRDADRPAAADAPGACPGVRSVCSDRVVGGLVDCCGHTAPATRWRGRVPHLRVSAGATVTPGRRSRTARL